MNVNNHIKQITKKKNCTTSCKHFIIQTKHQEVQSLAPRSKPLANKFVFMCLVRTLIFLFAYPQCQEFVHILSNHFTSWNVKFASSQPSLAVLGSCRAYRSTLNLCQQWPSGINFRNISHPSCFMKKENKFAFFAAETNFWYKIHIIGRNIHLFCRIIHEVQKL